MKYTESIVIHLPLERVVDLYMNPENYKHWMEGLQSFETISGTQGEEGSKTKFSFKMGKREIEMTETVLKKELPKEYTVSYEAKNVYNIVKNRFEEVEDNKTRLINEQEFRFGGFMKLLGMLMPGAFKKQSRKYLKDFKEFAEKQYN